MASAQLITATNKAVCNIWDRWAAPGLVTGYLQQTGSLAQLHDGTIVLAFGHKDDTVMNGTWTMFGQRAILSHDGGKP